MPRYLVNVDLSFVVDAISEEDAKVDCAAALEEFLTDNDLIQSELPEIHTITINKIAR